MVNTEAQLSASCENVNDTTVTKVLDLKKQKKPSSPLKTKQKSTVAALVM